jgi:hypothetical protein
MTFSSLRDSHYSVPSSVRISLATSKGLGALNCSRGNDAAKNPVGCVYSRHCPQQKTRGLSSGPNIMKTLQESQRYETRSQPFPSMTKNPVFILFFREQKKGPSTMLSPFSQSFLCDYFAADKAASLASSSAIFASSTAIEALNAFANGNDSSPELGPTSTRPLAVVTT